MDYHWPGNVRELQRSLEHAFVFVKGSVIQYHNLPADVEFNRTNTPVEIVSTEKKSSFNRESIQWALEQSSGSRNRAAKLLGISRTSLWRRMKEFNLL
jgi:transcriptional regulator with PAS, ATPase and Fis domain